MTARPMIIRWISLVPSKMVKIVDCGAVSAARWPIEGSDISTDSARYFRWRLVPTCLASIVEDGAGTVP